MQSINVFSSVYFPTVFLEGFASIASVLIGPLLSTMAFRETLLWTQVIFSQHRKKIRFDIMCGYFCVILLTVQQYTHCIIISRITENVLDETSCTLDQLKIQMVLPVDARQHVISIFIIKSLQKPFHNYWFLSSMPSMGFFTGCPHLSVRITAKRILIVKLIFRYQQGWSPSDWYDCMYNAFLLSQIFSLSGAESLDWEDLSQTRMCAHISQQGPNQVVMVFKWYSHDSKTYKNIDPSKIFKFVRCYEKNVILQRCI